MGIRLDQLHSEIFDKINGDLNNAAMQFKDFIDNKISEIDVVFGLPESTNVERDVETNKRNLEKSGFIEINRNFAPIRNATQAETGVWISNLNTNESPFEPQTIDGQKRGINVAGYNINYTKGNIGQNIDKMLKLPIAPNLPVFFPEDNDMRFRFKPSKKVITKKIVTDNAISISIQKRITDEHKIQISKMIDGSVTKYYYMDADSNIFFINENGRVFKETAPSTLLVEPYNIYTTNFGSTFLFDKIYDSEAVSKYIDPTTKKLFSIVSPEATTAKKILLTDYNQNNIFISQMKVIRSILVDGVLTEKEVEQPMLVKFNIVQRTINGLVTEVIEKTLMSEAKFEKYTETINNNTYTYITDNGIKMYVNSSKLYYYNPYRKIATDNEGNVVYETDSNGNVLYYDENNVTSLDPNKGKRRVVYVDDLSYVTYLDIGSDNPVTVNIVDNITGATITKTVYSEDVEDISYYRVDTLMNTSTGNVVCTLDDIGNYNKINGADAQPNTNRPVKLTVDGTLTTLTDGNTVVHSAGKEFYYYHNVGTKFYKRSNGNIYFVDLVGTVYSPANDVQEILVGTITNTDTSSSYSTMIYIANGLTFYMDTDSMRAYIEHEMYQQIQLSDLNGNRVFVKDDNTKVFASSSTEMFVLDAQGAEKTIPFSYAGITPLFETKDVNEDVLNLVIPVAFNIIQGNVVLTRNNQIQDKYSDYNVEGILSLSKPLEFNEEISKGDTLYIKRAGKKDLILRMEKTGSATNDTAGHWANNTGMIVMPEPLTGNYFNWTEGQTLVAGQQLDYNDVVKKDDKYFKYTGSAFKYEDMPANDKTVKVQVGGVFWEDITADELEWERKGQNYKILNAKKNDKIRFTLIRRLWEQHAVTGELAVVEQAPYIIEKVCANNGENLFIINDQKFILDDNASLESYILLIENIKDYMPYTGNRANGFKLMLTGLQTVARNEETAMIYGEDYFLAKNILYITTAEMTDSMILTRIQAPQAELKIDFLSVTEQPEVTVPFDIIKNKFDIITPQVLAGHEYTWIMNEPLPEGKMLKTGDVIFDKEHIKFYKFVGTPSSLIGKESLLRQSEDIQKEILRQYLKIDSDLNTGMWFSKFDVVWAKNAKALSDADSKSLTYFVNTDGVEKLNTTNKDVVDYLRKAREKMITLATHDLNNTVIDAMIVTPILTEALKTEIKRILSTDLPQSVLKKIKYNSENEPLLDEDGNIIYYYVYTRNFMVTLNTDKKFITRDINGGETLLNNVYVDITAPKVGYYRFGKTFTILNTKTRDNVVVRLIDSGAEAFTSARIISTGGEITFAIDFNIENDDGSEIAFEVVYEELNWTEGLDYIQEGQKLRLTMVEAPNTHVIIKRNDEFELLDIVVLERKDLVFIEVWHEAVDETGFIFPFGNVQYAGTTSDNISTTVFDKKFFDTLDGKTTIIPDGHKKYCQVYEKGNIVYNYYDGTSFDTLTKDERKFIDKTFVEDATVGRGWKINELNESERNVIFKNADHNLYYDGQKLIQIRYRTRVASLNLFENYFRGTSEYMSKGLKFQGKSPVTSRVITRQVGIEMDASSGNRGAPITETVQIFAGGNLIISSDEKSLMYKNGKLYDDALFTVEEQTDLSHNGYVYAIPVAIVNRRNQGAYHPEFNDNGTGFFINGIHVSEDKSDFADDITGFTLVDETSATLETASVGRDRKAKFKVMLNWLFSTDYKAGGSMVSRTTYRPDGLLYDEINTKDIIDLRIDANDQRKRIEDLESETKRGFRELYEFKTETKAKFEQTQDYINTTANLLYAHITKTESAIRNDMNVKDAELTLGLEKTNTNLSDLSANVFTKDITKSLLVDSILGLTDYNTNAAFVANHRPTREDIEGMVNAFAENMEGPYTKAEFMKFLVTVLKAVVNKTMFSDSELDRWIRRLSVKDLSIDTDTSIYTRAEILELIYEGLILASSARVLPPIGAEKLENWAWKGTRYDGWLGTKQLELVADFIENGKTPVATKNILTSSMTRSYQDVLGVEWNSGYIAGPTVWGNIHNYSAIYTTWIFVETPFKVDYVKMNGDDSHAIFINQEKIASNKYCCRDTAYSYDFAVAGWYRIDAVYTEKDGGHYIQLGWNPKDYADKIKYMTTTDMDDAVRITKLRLDNWASKMKSLVSTIKGDGTDYFTKLETKLILIEGLQRIRHHILTSGPAVSTNDLNAFHTGDAVNPGLESWLDNINGDGKFTSLNYEVQPGTNASGVEYARSDLFRPIVDMTGTYNKDEIIEIVRKAFELVNGIDSLNSDGVQKWVDRLNIKLPMTTVTYFTTAQINELIKAGRNYLAGLDKVTSYEISSWLDTYVKKTFYSVSGVDLTKDTLATASLTKVLFKQTIGTNMKDLLGAQSSKKV